MSATVSPAPCRWCGHYHGPRCPSVQAMEFHPDGSVKRVEFVNPVPIPPGGNRIEIDFPGSPIVPMGSVSHA